MTQTSSTGAVNSHAINRLVPINGQVLTSPPDPAAGSEETVLYVAAASPVMVVRSAAPVLYVRGN